MTISIIIVSYNVKHYLEQCIWSVIQSAKDIEYEIFIVDNNSTDDSPAYLKKAFQQCPNLHFICNKDNIGFGHANNQALRQAKGEFILFLNPDTILTENTLTDYINFYREHPEAGAVGVKMLRPNGKFALESRRGLPTPFTSCCKMLGLSRLFPKSRLFGRYYMQYLDEKDSNPIQVVSGACMMVPHAILDKTGGFDEQFFMYGEDIDLSCRILENGNQNYYIPTPILHYKGESTEKSSFRYVHIFYGAMLIYFNKHYKHSYFLLTIPIRIAVNIIAIFTLIQHTFDEWKRWIRPVQKKQNTFLFIGTEEHYQKLTRMAEQWGLKIEFCQGNEQENPEGHLTHNIDKFKYIIYDTEVYSMKQILSNFEQSQKPLIGTYSAQRNILITNEKTYTV